MQQYLKLSGLLEQNRRTGTKNLRDIFQTEMADALEQRKNLALRLGEEAGTRLLIPLFLMLGIVMVMIMVPAMMSMG
jgi:1,4-dihydroxy-2-naphthoate octaprenyltransferase